jgi:Heterokaryon incompatibility protein (HET)
MTTPDLYTYRPLPSRSIRILRCLPKPKSLEIELLEVPLDSPPAYEALSYTWDGQEPNRPLKCDGKVLNVTENCHTALTKLRQRKNEGFWIDSICIDQTSVSEKNAQVPLMGEIYKKARRVLVWLGESTPEKQLAVSYLQPFARLSIKYLLRRRPIFQPGTYKLSYRFEQDVDKLKSKFRGMDM